MSEPFLPPDCDWYCRMCHQRFISGASNGECPVCGCEGAVVLEDVGGKPLRGESIQPPATPTRPNQHACGCINWLDRCPTHGAKVDPVQPAPTPNDHPALWPLVIGEFAGRDAFGRQKYKTPLQPHNGRDYLRDAMDEALDLVVYLRGLIYERDGK